MGADCWTSRKPKAIDSLNVQLSGSTNGSAADSQTSPLQLARTNNSPTYPTENLQPCLTPLTCTSLIHEEAVMAEDTIRTHSDPTSIKIRTGVMKTILGQLGIEVEDQIITRLVDKYDGVTPMARYLAENGYWTPLAPSADEEARA